PSPPLPPASPLTPAGHDRRGMLVGGLAGLIILIAAVVFLLSSRTHRTSGTVNVSLATTVPAISPTTVNTTTTVATTRPTNGPSTTLASVGHLIVGGPKTLDFGGTTSSASVIVGNDGPVPLDFTATASGTGLTVNPVAGTLSSGGNQTLTLTLERALPPTGPFTGTILIASPGGNAGIMVTAVIDAGPTISGENASAPLVYATTCLHTTPTAPRMSNIAATVTGPLPLKVVVLHWQSPVIGATGTSTMAGSGTTYSGTLGPYTSAGTVDWWITAIDSANATSMSNHHTLAVFCSP
nr:hypothetical protein [Actinomycetota bacterium]